MRSLCLSLAYVLFSTPIAFSDARINTIFIVNSYTGDFVWTKNINENFIKKLSAAGWTENTHYKLVKRDLDAFKNHNLNSLEKISSKILNEIRKTKPDIIVTTDDDALINVGLKINDTPVVFNGIHAIADYLPGGKHSGRINSLGKPGQNITGVYQVDHINETFKLLKMIKPSVQKVAILVDTTTSGKATLAGFQKEIKNLSIQVSDILVSDSFKVWKRKIKEWQNKTDAILYMQGNGVRDEGGRLMKVQEIIRYIADHSKLPDMATWEQPVEYGILLSAGVSPDYQGFYTAEKVLSILKDKAKPGEILINVPLSGQPMVNIARAKKLNLFIPQELMNILVENGKIYR